MNIWLDDERPMPLGFDVLCRTAEEAINCLKISEVRIISLDHDLGGELTGYDVAKYIAQLIVNHKPYPQVFIHSQNPIGVSNIIAVLKSAERFVNGQM